LVFYLCVLWVTHRKRVSPRNPFSTFAPTFSAFLGEVVGLIHELTLPLIRVVSIPPSPLDKGGDSFNFLATFLGEIALRVLLWNNGEVKG
jgi:hypothetical protein